MDDDWAPLLNKDCMLFSPSGLSVDDDFHLTNLDRKAVDKDIKAEIQEETSDYKGSLSGSPSSSLSSPDMKDNLGVDLSFCIPFSGNIHPFLHSPTNINGSLGPVFSTGNITQQHSPLPPVSNFSHQMTLHQQEQLNQQHCTHQQVTESPLHRNHSPLTAYNVTTQQTCTFFGDRTPSPPTSDRSSPANGMLTENLIFGGFSGSSMPCGSGIVSSLSAAQQQLKSRSKMHEMAVRHRLITDQDPRSQGVVQLSAEERRTLIQEGYPIPTRLPLSKAEEESLKIVRRKIKNKLSAQESRRKRKEYMDTLESRCQTYYNENNQLKNRVRQLELSNQKLIVQMKKLQDMMNATEQNSDTPLIH